MRLCTCSALVADSAESLASFQAQMALPIDATEEITPSHQKKSFTLPPVIPCLADAASGYKHIASTQAAYLQFFSSLICMLVSGSQRLPIRSAAHFEQVCHDLATFHHRFG